MWLLTVLLLKHLIFHYIALIVLICKNDERPSDFSVIVKKKKINLMVENIWLVQPLDQAGKQAVVKYSNFFY